MENRCPKCYQELSWNSSYYCEQCELSFEKNAYCDKCDKQVEKLKACGAVQYFCNHCNELKSKSAVRFEFSSL